jgi:hypothetical protein
MLSSKKHRNREIQGKARPEQYSSEGEALEMARKLEERSNRKFIVQHSMVHRNKWVIIECWGFAGSTA